MSPTFPTGVYEKRAVSRGNIPIISYFYEFNLIFRVKRPGKNGVEEKHPGLNHGERKKEKIIYND